MFYLIWNWLLYSANILHNNAQIDCWSSTVCSTFLYHPFSADISANFAWTGSNLCLKMNFPSGMCWIVSFESLDCALWCLALLHQSVQRICLCWCPQCLSGSWRLVSCLLFHVCITELVRSGTVIILGMVCLEFVSGSRFPLDFLQESYIFLVHWGKDHVSILNYWSHLGFVQGDEHFLVHGSGSQVLPIL